uniref:Uncharacterized protein n=1 Tax=Haemonchus contortus TaxID=6289 RepID=W6NE84_HAECO
MRVVGLIPDTAAADNLTPTPVDLSKVLKSLGSDFKDQLSEEDLEKCELFKGCREIIENYTEHPEAIPNMTDDQKDEYEIAEQYVSRTLKRMVKIMLRVRRPSVIYIPFEFHRSQGDLQILHARLQDSNWGRGVADPVAGSPHDR